MNIHRALSARVTAAVLALGLATTAAADAPAFAAVWAEASTSQICIVNTGDEVAAVNPSSVDGDMALVLILPKSADADKISLAPSPGWTVAAREFQSASRALVLSVTPDVPVMVKGRSVAGCFELGGILPDALGPIGLLVRERNAPETAPPVRR